MALGLDVGYLISGIVKMKFFEGLSLLLFGLNISGVITISYWWVVLPVLWQWIIGPMLTGVFIGCIVALIDEANGDTTFSKKFKKIMIEKMLGNKQSIKEQLKQEVNKEQI